MRILHTSDWHLGRQLFGRKRYDEFEAFLDWVAQTIEHESIEVLLIAGDVFDTSTPSNRAQELYYRFLCRMAASSVCRHVVIIAGNHDSPSFLDAPKSLLRALQVHVIGQAQAQPEDEVVVLHDAQQRPELIVCAVPYLRDRDLRTSQAGESLQDKERQLLEGIRQHYATVAAHAQTLREGILAQERVSTQIQSKQNANGLTAARTLPIIGMGHLFTAGGQTVDGDGVRELYVGSLAHVGASIFPTSLDYVALGHLHVAQIVGGNPCIRYSGSPIPMGFGEAAQRKSVCILQWPTEIVATPVDTASAAIPPAITQLEVPCFQSLVRIQGDWATIAQQLQDVVSASPKAWLEVTYSGQDIITDLRERIDGMLQGTQIEVLRIRNQRIVQQLLTSSQAHESLEDLSPQQVFERCLDAHNVPAEQRHELVLSYQEVLRTLEQEDTQAD
ncbi:exonuclease subunit SbcD [Lampropedia puyangensis]|uniref:Nuclease SbcCD subunit D n=1 Tax=Lampropedia puyangensis TaxID=1330072 RepID=A0A4S8EVI0_9BURK|nr:exonuclease SbcCD subunit D C-terminal domain-containing protein [Lampropedia puyangensis]THT98468.1 exonuclease subunit SbcD [Lampropedia puyangensis]